MSKTIVIDIQGYKVENNKFVPKELAAYNGEQYCHFIFKPPFPIEMLPDFYKKQVIWLENNHHCLQWKEGFTPLYQFPKIIQQLSNTADVFYVKGKEKALYLQKYIKNKKIIELDEQPALKKMESKCLYHLNKFCYCSLTITMYLYDHFFLNKNV